MYKYRQSTETLITPGNNFPTLTIYFDVFFKVHDVQEFPSSYSSLSFRIFYFNAAIECAWWEMVASTDRRRQWCGLALALLARSPWLHELNGRLLASLVQTSNNVTCAQNRRSSGHWPWCMPSDAWVSQAYEKNREIQVRKKWNNFKMRENGVSVGQERPSRKLLEAFRAS